MEDVMVRKKCERAKCFLKAKMDSEIKIKVKERKHTGCRIGLDQITRKQESPLCTVPPRNTVKAHINKFFETERKKCIEILGDVPYLSLTTDICHMVIYVSDSQMNTMLGITVHELKENKFILQQLACSN
jgi:hypothetical protein